MINDRNPRSLRHILIMTRLSLLIAVIGGGWIAGAASLVLVAFIGFGVSAFCAYAVLALSDLWAPE